ncbi:ubiquitin thiolesterase [Phlyctema vagabunda]|uniref:ubiquitinyl hydrolase 1 n=1 Tax=Phlyctema vagabunda TaxID=108571 RepID=A0ABR4PAX3_9HELO
MFHPQPTPFTSFPSSAYSLSSASSASSFQPNSGVVDSGGPTLFRDPVFSSSSPNGLPFHNPPPPPPPTPLRRRPQPPKMEEHPTADDMAAQQTLAESYSHHLAPVGPLVGDKKSSVAIAQEYAKADPVYVAKTAHLPQIYSHYRPIAGDGNCGWRAIAFSYLETLLRTGDQERLQEEAARMRSLDNMLVKIGGFEEWMIEDFTENTHELLRELADTVHDPDHGLERITEKLNEDGTSSSIVYHLRMLAVSWLKGNADTYSGFIQDVNGVQGYGNVLQSVNQEIDHLGMTLLIDVLLKPIGFAVEIVYLDRSEGTEANTHVMQEVDTNGVPVNPDGPRIYLLYRPGHYDILYKELIPIPVQPDLQVNRATSFSQQHTPTVNSGYNLDYSMLAHIPGFSIPAPHAGGYAAPYAVPEFAPSPMSSSISPISPGASSASTSNSFSLPPKTSVHLSHHPLHASSSLGSPSSFRPSKYNYEAAGEWPDSAPTLQTNAFKNSHFNTAHYNNQNFQPEQWTPECEETASSGSGGRKKSQ